MEETGKNPIQVAERLFQVIERLAENGPMGIMDLSAELGFHKSTTHRLVTSLQYMGYIRQDEESLKYALSLKFLEIGSKILEQTNMASLIHPSLKKLSEQTGALCLLLQTRSNSKARGWRMQSGQNSMLSSSISFPHFLHTGDFTNESFRRQSGQIIRPEPPVISPHTGQRRGYRISRILLNFMLSPESGLSAPNTVSVPPHYPPSPETPPGFPRGRRRLSPL